jgi:radical SAM protein with 4Fe4S-binding SPASM domain
MLLNPQVMLRKEENYFVIYNGNTGRAVTVSLEDGEAINNINLQYFIDNKNTKCLLKLKEMGFIQLPENFKTSDSDNTDIQEVNVLTLKSHTTPYKVLWGLTPKCNLKCLYCWPDVASVVKKTKGLSSDQLQKIAKQLVAAKVCKVIISGGEALLCKEIWNVIKTLRDGGLTVILISNGTTITEDVLEKVKKYNVALGISLDAPNDEINALTRRKNIVQTVSNAIVNTLKENIPLGVLVTVTRYNFDSLEEHISYLNTIGAKVIILQDLRPFGTINDYSKARLSINQEIELPKLLEKTENKYPHIRFDFTELLSFSNKCSIKTTNNKIMQCEAGDNSGYIDFHGNFYPCSFLESFNLGNLLDEGKTITNLWKDSPNIKKLRKLKNMSIEVLKDCHGCSQINNCDGGCRGDALFNTGDLYGQASRCPKKMGII